MEAITDILVETGRLALAAGVPWLPVIAMLLLLAAIRVLGPKIDLPKGESGPANPNDETPAPGSPLNTDPDHPGGDHFGG